MTPDPTTFLTAIFQAGATLVAIVAGIIGARFVAAHGDVQALRDRHDRLHQEQESVLAKSQRAGLLSRRKRAERRASSAQFLDSYVSTQDQELVRRKAESMDPRIREFFVGYVERIDEYLPQCEALVQEWGERVLSIGTLRGDGAPNGGTLESSVYAHFVLDRAKRQRHLSSEHERKVENLSAEVKRRDTARHRTLQHLIEERTGEEALLAEQYANLEREAAAARKQLDVLEAGEGFRLGLRVLGLVSVLAMIPPVALLLYRPVAWDRWPDLAAAIGFGAGILIVLRFLYIYSEFLKGVSRLPHVALALLLPRRWWRSGSEVPTTRAP